jgi:flagellar basal-body rod modification protein FlgD
MDINALSSFSNSVGAADNDNAKLAEDFDDFLTLLTTQLQHQDPMDPMDSGEFTNQLVAFTGVEQQITTNKNLETLATLTAMANVGSAVSYLGQEALVERSMGDHTADGITWQYANSTDIGEITLRVVTEDGATVYETTGNDNLGVHEFAWDGYTSGGSLAGAGNYELQIEATDADGEDITTGIAVKETITAVDTTGLEPLFTVGPNTVGQTDIMQLFLGQ